MHLKVYPVKVAFYSPNAAKPTCNFSHSKYHCAAQKKTIKEIRAGGGGIAACLQLYIKLQQNKALWCENNSHRMAKLADIVK